MIPYHNFILENRDRTIIFISVKERYNPYIIILIAAAVRLVQILQLPAFPLTYYPTVDALFHKLWAEQILRGNFLGDGAFFRAPFYPYFLAAIFKIFGTNLLISRVIQHIIGIGAVLLTYRLADRAFGKRAAFWAGIIAAVYPTKGFLTRVSSKRHNPWSVSSHASEYTTFLTIYTALVPACKKGRVQEKYPSDNSCGSRCDTHYLPRDTAQLHKEWGFRPYRNPRWSKFLHRQQPAIRWCNSFHP
ncbi:MAG: hypothetical protein B6D65_05840 [candidate division Zixibacteria bacterium 4484_93]|nr:MAG: hypothetical protein B6D65_05840 [candidate division Zixibacteria bacterium 4484_93]